MSSQISRLLTSLASEIEATRAELGRLRDRLETQRAVLEECRLRMLIAETPIAGRELHVAADGFLRVEGEVREVERALETLFAEQQRLAAGVAGAGS